MQRRAAAVHGSLEPDQEPVRRLADRIEREQAFAYGEGRFLPSGGIEIADMRVEGVDRERVQRAAPPKATRRTLRP